MKREIIAVILLLLIFVGALINIRANDRIVGDLESEVRQAYKSAQSGDTEKAKSLLSDAEEHWLSLDGYTHIFIRHSEIDSLTDAFFDFYSSLDEEPSSIEGAYNRLIAHLESIRTMEHLRFGSIL